MKLQQLKVRKIMTIEDKKVRKEAKRILEINIQLNSQYSIKGFHRIFTYEGDEDGVIRKNEIKAADKKIAELVNKR